MSAEIGTLSELSAKPGDVVEPIGVSSFGRETLADPQGTGFTFVNEKLESLGCVTRWRMVKRRPRTWGELTDAEKGALLLARHEGKHIEVWAYWREPARWQRTGSPAWGLGYKYRVKPEPVVETRTHWVHANGERRPSEYRVIDGKVDWDTFKVLPNV